MHADPGDRRRWDALLRDHRRPARRPRCGDRRRALAASSRPARRAWARRPSPTGRCSCGTGVAFVAVDPISRNLIWSADTHGEETGSATVAGGVAYLGAAAETTATGTLHAFDASTGTPLWTADRARHAIPTVVDGVAYSSGNSGELAAFDAATGRTRWSVQIGGELKSPVVSNGIVYVSAADAHRLLAFEAATGNVLWSFDLDGPANCCIAVAKGRIVVGALSGSVYSIVGDGATLTGRPAPTPTATPHRARRPRFPSARRRAC